MQRSWEGEIAVSRSIGAKQSGRLQEILAVLDQVGGQSLHLPFRQPIAFFYKLEECGQHADCSCSSLTRNYDGDLESRESIQLLILHLSDIHFRKMEIGTAQDPNFHLRNELVRDVRLQCQALGPPDVIVVSGDTAFAGDPAEFGFATEWLSALCDACNGSLETVFVVPGNHDAVRETAEKNLVQMIHRDIKAAVDPSEAISRHMRDPSARRLLYESLDNYNEFALQFLCDLLPPDRTRAVRDLSLCDGSTLRLWGLNTALVSSQHDKLGSLFVDPASRQITREEGVVNFVVAHHHLSWLGQAQQLEDHLADVAPVQLFGHVHTNRITLNRDFVRLTASAANPDRHEAGWEPGYNLIELSVDGCPDHRRLHLRAHVRVWQEAPGGFQAKMDRTSSVFEHWIDLEPWHAPVATDIKTEVEELALGDDGNGQARVISLSSDPLTEGGPAMNTLRDVGLRFYRLSFSKKSEIAGRLELLEDEDMGQPDFERFRRVFMRAHERGRLDEFAEAVRAAEQA